MLDHSRFEELATLAALRELSPEECDEFEQHRSTCPPCRELFKETHSVAADLFLAGSQRMQAADRSIELDHRLRKAIAQQLPQVVSKSVVASYRHRMIGAVAATFILGAGLGLAISHKWQPASTRMQSAVAKASDSPQSSKSAPIILDRNEGSQPQALIADLHAQIEEGHREAQAIEGKLSASDERAAQLQAQLDEMHKKAAEMATDLAKAHTDASSMRNELSAVTDSSSQKEAQVASLESRLAERDARMGEMTASLEREKEMLSDGREIRDIMGARDLHIIDVIDRDGKGHPRKAFGRAFYTQGKSLIFYAFDLPAKGIEDGRFVYAAWGSNSNQLSKTVAHSLGIFYNDDQTQHRWAIKYDDPRVLDEIDTVFVTLEPAGKPFSTPTGKPLLEAYFGTPPNHP